MPKTPLSLNTIPGLTRELVTALDTLFPDRCPDIQDTERSIWMYAGQRQLVRNLKTIMERQERGIDESTQTRAHLGMGPHLGSHSTADKLAGL